MTRFLLATALAFGSVGVAAAPAVAQSYSPSQLVASVDQGTLKAVIEDTGGTIEANDDGTFNVVLSNGIKARSVFTACSEGPCKGMNILAGFTLPDGKTAAEVSKLVHDFNAKWSAAKTYVSEDGTPMVQGYVIFDGGITMENLRMQLQVFAGVAKKLSETLNESE